MKPCFAVALSLAAFLVAAFVGHAIRPNTPGTPFFADGSSPLPEVGAELPPALLVPAISTYPNLLAALTNTGDAAVLEQLFEQCESDAPRRRLVMLRWAEIDPEAAFNFLLHRPSESIRLDSCWDAVFTTWAAGDVESAFAHCLDFADPYLSHHCARSALDGAANLDPEKAFSLFFATRQQLPASNEYRTAGWLSENPRTSLDLIQELAPDLKWSKAIREDLLESWVQSDPGAAHDWVLVHADALTEEEQNVFARGLAATDSAGAAAFVASLPAAHRWSQTTGIIAAGIAESDPAAALIWIDETLTGETKQRALSSMLDEWAATDPAAAAPLVKELGTEVSSYHSDLNKMMHAWVQSSPTDAGAWIDSLDPGRFREFASRAFGAAWFRHDQKSAEALLHQSSPQSIPTDVVKGIASQAIRSRSDDENVAWANALPDRVAVEVVGLIAGGSAYSDPLTAGYIAGSFRSPELQSIAARSVVHNAIRGKPEALGAWIAAQPDPVLRSLFLEALKAPNLPPDQVAIALQHVNTKN